MLRRHSKLSSAGSNHFVTTVTRIRGNWFVEPKTCTSLLTLFEWCRNRYRLDCIGYVLMPDHFHLVLHQPEQDRSISQCQMQFKKMSSGQLRIPQFHEVRLWQNGYDDVLIPGADAVITKLKYVHSNPVRRGLVENAIDYLWSSSRFYEGRESGLITVRHFSS
jgi:putative transposase